MFRWRLNLAPGLSRSYAYVLCYQRILNYIFPLVLVMSISDTYPDRPLVPLPSPVFGCSRLSRLSPVFWRQFSHTQVCLSQISPVTEWLLFSCRVLGVFAKLRKATVSFVMSVGPSVRPHGTTPLPKERFSFHLLFFENLSGKLNFH